MMIEMTGEISVPEGKHGNEEHRHKNDEQNPYHDDRPTGPAKGGVFRDIRIYRCPAMRTIGCTSSNVLAAFPALWAIHKTLSNFIF